MFVYGPLHPQVFLPLLLLSLPLAVKELLLLAEV